MVSVPAGQLEMVVCSWAGMFQSGSSHASLPLGSADVQSSLVDLFHQIPSCHALRHWFASVGFDAGMGEVQIARLLGHRSTATTKDTYGHLLDDGAQTLIDSVARILREKN